MGGIVLTAKGNVVFSGGKKAERKTRVCWVFLTRSFSNRESEHQHKVDAGSFR